MTQEEFENLKVGDTVWYWEHMKLVPDVEPAIIVHVSKEYGFVHTRTAYGDTITTSGLFLTRYSTTKEKLKGV